MTPTFDAGALVRARDREWIVQPGSDPDFLILKPIDGSNAETTGILTSLEPVESAHFPLPTPDGCGDAFTWRLLRDAHRLSVRSAAGPFRSFGSLAVEPRAYQLVPLLMALRLDPVRMLIADDVGIGKTIEALLIARELLDQGTVERIGVLCSPALAEQWHQGMRDKFNIDAALVLTSTVTELERACGPKETLFDRYPHVVVSTDFIKADSRRRQFLDQAPELIIVDEAHTAVPGAGAHLGMTQKYQLVRGLADDPTRHLLLVTATPHSGKAEAFKTLLGLLDDELDELPDDLTGKDNEPLRRRLARHFVQRRRGNIERYLDEDTPFPKRETTEADYDLSPEYHKFLDGVLDFARSSIVDEHGQLTKRRRWWALLGLLRAVASSPAAAASALRTKAEVFDANTEAEIEAAGRRTVLDVEDELDGSDVVPGGRIEDDTDPVLGRKLLGLAKQADKLAGESDAKLQRMIQIIRGILKDGYSPIIFCRYISTAEYIEEHLTEALGSKVGLDVITGTLPATDREARVAELGTHKGPRLLVATDCLSEGVNLQDHFNAVFHYDLAWSPTRHEQREGRVDRYGQPKPIVRALTYYGRDNGIDGIVLQILIRKHQAIRKATGISVPVPEESDSLVTAIMEGAVLRTEWKARQLTFEGLEDEAREELELEWDRATEREKASRQLFAQNTIDPREVEAELAAIRAVLGRDDDVEAFVGEAVSILGGTCLSEEGRLSIDLTEAPAELAELWGEPQLSARFRLPLQEDGEVYLHRTHPFVEGLSRMVLRRTVAGENGISRCGARRSRQIGDPLTALLVRYRFLIDSSNGHGPRQGLAETSEILVFAGSAAEPEWLPTALAEETLSSVDLDPVDPGSFARITETLANLGVVQERLAGRAELAGTELQAAHLRVREAARRTGHKVEVRPHLPPDILGVYTIDPSS